MSIFKRMKDMTKASLNDMLDKIEDPVVRLNQYLRDMENEIHEALEIGGKVISLGKRILRTETAAITSVSMCMLHAEMNLSE